jgi:dihydrofolate synthase/folylpolyglutamate synthase
MSHRDYLFSLEQIGIKLGLDQIRALTGGLGHPERAFRSIIVAGTNGKGSVTAMVERGLRAAGYRTGRYTSPHLIRIEERFAIDGAAIDASTCDAAAGRVRAAAGRLPAPPTFFEATTALAFDVFREAGIDWAVLEVGLGGRLDATNVVDAVAAAITAIDLDHQEHLGPTIERIAAEKAAVIKPGAAVAVLADNPPAVEAVVRGRCEAVGVPLVVAGHGVVCLSAHAPEERIGLDVKTPRGRYGVTLGLRGRHQVGNAILAVRLLEEITAAGLAAVPGDAVRTGLEDVVWPARLEAAKWRGHDVLVDGAHNPAGARALQAYLAETYERRLPIVLAVMREKSVDQMVAALAPSASYFVCTAPATPRAMPPSDLLAAVRRVAPGVPVEAAASPIDALARAVTYGSPAVVAGSLYLAGEIRAEWA